MKKYLSLILAALMIISLLPLSVLPSLAATSGDYTYSVNIDGTATITGYYGAGGDVTVPSKLDGHKVTSIGDYAFYYCESLTSITIPDSVTSIGYDAFCYCTSLTSITIGNGVTSIGDVAFSGCYDLTDVYYTGTEEEWNSISIGSLNDSLLNATIHFEYEEEITPADANGDGNVDMRDVLVTRQFLAGLIDEDEVNYDAADVNGDGSVDARDVLMMRKFIAGLIEF